MFSRRSVAADEAFHLILNFLARRLGMNARRVPGALCSSN